MQRPDRKGERIAFELRRQPTAPRFVQTQEPDCCASSNAPGLLWKLPALLRQPAKSGPPRTGKRCRAQAEDSRGALRQYASSGPLRSATRHDLGRKLTASDSGRGKSKSRESTIRGGSRNALNLSQQLIARSCGRPQKPSDVSEA